MAHSESNLEFLITNLTEIHERTLPWETNEFCIPDKVGLQMPWRHRSRHNKQINPPKRMPPYKRQVAGGGYKHRH